MKASKKKRIALCGCAAVAALLTGVAFWIFGTVPTPTTQTVSAGVQYLADGTYMAASAPVGERITFSPAWFDGQLQGARVQGITLTALPEVTDGELKLGEGEVSVGQRIDRSDLSYLSFTPTEVGVQSSFSFVAHTREGEGGYELDCLLLQTGAQNCCPTAKGSVTAVTTHETLSVCGELEASDPEGDALYFEVVRYPENGTLHLNAETGYFTYQPVGDFSGEDSFSYRVQDACGAFSEAAEVKVSVASLTGGYLFSDIEEDGLHSAALTVAERGLLGGERVGGKHYFHPERRLTRAAFVCVLLRAAEIECDEAEDTGYTDNAEIPKGMRGAIKHARDEGWLGEDTAFRPGDAITRAEAAEIACRVLGLAAPGYSDAVEDHDAIPVGVVDAMYAALEGGYIQTMADGTLAHAAPLTRGDAALFFTRVLVGK